MNQIQVCLQSGVLARSYVYNMIGRVVNLQSRLFF